MTEPSVQPPQTPPQTSKNPWSDALSYPLATLGALIGGALGVLVFKWALAAGFYVIPVIGVLAGWGAAILSRRSSWPIGILAGLLTAALALWAEWKFYGAFHEDDSFLYFLRNITQLATFKLVSHAVGVAVAIWLGARK
jgi:hypothetical protein